MFEYLFISFYFIILKSLLPTLWPPHGRCHTRAGWSPNARGRRSSSPSPVGLTCCNMYYPPTYLLVLFILVILLSHHPSALRVAALGGVAHPVDPADAGAVTKVKVPHRTQHAFARALPPLSEEVVRGEAQERGADTGVRAWGGVCER